MARWLAELAVELRDRIPTGLPPIPPAAPENAVQAVGWGEDHDPLLSVPQELAVRHVYQDLPIQSLPAKVQLRAGLICRLIEAQRSLPRGIGLVILDAWRTSQFQADLLAYYRALAGEDLGLYVSDPANTVLMAPHTTGGAVDLTLTVDGVPVAMGTDFDSFADAAHVRALDDVPDDADPRLVLDRDLRRLLAQVLLSADIAPYPLEWWHWSYGDQRWAAFVGRDRTCYSPIE